MSDVVASMLPHVVECTQEFHCFSRKRGDTAKVFKNKDTRLTRPSAFTEFIPRADFRDTVKYLLTARLQKNPEVDGDQLSGELEWTNVRTSGGEKEHWTHL